MADSYEKRARERRKQQKRRSKLEERRAREPGDAADVPESAWFGLEEEEEEGGGETKE